MIETLDGPRIDTELIHPIMFYTNMVVDSIQHDVSSLRDRRDVAPATKSRIDLRPV